MIHLLPGLPGELGRNTDSYLGEAVDKSIRGGNRGPCVNG